MKEVLNYIESNKKRYVEELCDLLRIPSISTQPEHKKDVIQCAKKVAGELERIGMSKVEVHETQGHPIVYAEWMKASGKPTVLFYGHYDVQPADPVEEWDSPPFEPTIKGSELFARGVSDDKGQFYTHIKAVEAFLNKTGGLPVNVKFLIEGEEETGGENLPNFIKNNPSKLKCDTILISDSTMYEENCPTILYNLRGIVVLQLDIQGPKRDLHSGAYGGMVENPANALATIIAKLKDENGKITIPAFYEDIRPLSQMEKEMFATLHFNEAAYKKELGIPALVGEKGFGPLERIWVRPTLDVHGFLSGYTSQGFKSIIPSKAMAKLSMRLVPDQNPKKILELAKNYIKKLTPPGVVLKITEGDIAWPYIASLDMPSMKAIRTSFKQSFGKEAIFAGGGGSIPIVTTFKEVLGVDSLLIGIGVPDDHAHGPNEKMDLDSFQKGILNSAYFLNQMANI